MQKVFNQTFDAVKISEECKQKLKNTLIEYQNNIDLSKKAKEKKKFQWTMRRVVIATSIAVVMIFCAIFIPLMAMNGGESGGTDMTATYKMQLLTAINGLKTTQSYIETIEITMIIDGEEILSTYTTSYLKTSDGYTAAGLMEASNGMSQRFYVVGGYMYTPVAIAEQPQNDEEKPPAWTQIGGIKIRLQEDFISLVQFFANNLGYLTPETVNGLTRESNIKIQAIERQTVYTFKSIATHNAEITESDYTVSVDAIHRIIDIKQIINIKEADGKTTTGVMNAAYDYVAVTIDLPDDLETYPEYTG